MANSEKWWRNHPSLSELRGTPLYWSVCYRFSLHAIVALMLCFTFLTLYFGHKAGANVMVVKPILKLAGADMTVTVDSAPPALTGYLYKGNHALFYLTLAPLALYLGLRYLVRLNDLLKSLMEEKLLLPNDVAEATRRADSSIRQVDDSEELAFLKDLARRNRKVFRMIPFALIFFGIGWNAWREANTWRNADVVNGGTGTFGYMQAKFFPMWRDEFNNRPAEEKIVKLSKLEIWPDIQRRIAEAIQENDRVRETWSSAGLLTLAGRRLSVDEFSRRSPPDRINVIDFRQALQQKMLTIDVECRGGTTASNAAWFMPFFISVVVLEGAFHGFSLWILVKFIAWIVLINRLLPKSSLKFTLEPNLNDEDCKQCGFISLHKTYNFIVFAAGIAVFAYLFQRDNNILDMKDLGSPQLRSSLVIGISIILLILALYCVPYLLNRDKIKSVQKAALRREQQKLEGLQDQASQMAVLNRKRIIESQVTWPTGDKPFAAGMAVIILVVVAPWLVAIFGEATAKFLEPIAKYTDVTKTVAAFLRWVCERFYLS